MRKTNGIVFKRFDSEDARFGAYLSTDMLGCRLRLDARPVVMGIGEKKTEHILFNFNFQQELSDPDSAVDTICSILSRWDDAKRESSKIIQSADTGI